MMGAAATREAKNKGWSEARHAEGCQNLEFTRKIILDMTQAINDLTIEITHVDPTKVPFLSPVSDLKPEV
jgi:hypothetical protein